MSHDSSSQVDIVGVLGGCFCFFKDLGSKLLSVWPSLDSLSSVNGDRVAIL